MPRSSQSNRAPRNGHPARIRTANTDPTREKTPTSAGETNLQRPDTTYHNKHNNSASASVPPGSYRHTRPTDTSHTDPPSPRPAYLPLPRQSVNQAAKPPSYAGRTRAEQATSLPTNVTRAARASPPVSVKRQDRHPAFRLCPDLDMRIMSSNTERLYIRNQSRAHHPARQTPAAHTHSQPRKETQSCAKAGNQHQER